jgi:TolB-like protein
MKRLGIVIILLILASIAYANSIDRRVRALLDDLAKKYVLTQQTLVSKKTVTLVEIRNISPLAEKNYVGEAVAERIKTAVQDSLVFTYVDRELLEEALEEIELSLSDFSEGSTVEVGRIEEVELLLTGSVLEEGEDFLITLQLVDVETTTLVAVSQTRFAKTELIEAGSQYAFAYIMANGIGTSLLFSPAHFLVYPLQPKVRHGDDVYHAFAGGARFSYRLSRKWKVGLDVSFSTHDVYYGSLPFGAVQNVPQEGKDYAYTLGYIESDGNIVEPLDGDYNPFFVENLAVN